MRAKITIALIIVFVLAGGWFLFEQWRKPATSEELRIHLVDLRSQTVEAQLIADLLAATDFTREYGQRQLRLLRSETEILSTELQNAAAQAPLGDELSEMRRLARQVADIEQRMSVPQRVLSFENEKAALRDTVRRLIALEQFLVKS